MVRESENKKCLYWWVYCVDKMRWLFVFFVVQWDDQYVDMNGVNQLVGRGYQFVLEVLMMVVDYQVYIVFFNCIDQYLVKVVVVVQGFGDGIVCVG